MMVIEYQEPLDARRLTRRCSGMVAAALCLLCTVPAAGADVLASISGPSLEQRAHTEWVGKVYDRMLAITLGMTRAQLLQVFERDGGLSTSLQGRFVSRDCLYFKVEVEFEAVGRPFRDANGRITMVEANEDRIIRISRPYMEPRFAD
jgi:hypothetical protein